MNRKELEAFGKEVAKVLKTEDALNDFRKMLTKVTAEEALQSLDEFAERRDDKYPLK